MKKITLGLIFSSSFAVCPDGFVEDDCGDCWASYCYDMNTHIPDYQTTEEACLEANVPFLPIHKSMISEPNLSNWLEPDGIHLNSDGHYWIYKKVMNWSLLLEWAELHQLKNLTPMAC